MSLNQRVMDFARTRLGRRVGSGECWDLAEEALKSVGAKTSTDLGDVGPDSNYVWGMSVPLSAVQAGDIVQFRDHSFKVTITKTGTDGTEEEEWDRQKRPHHTAIVAMVRENGKLEVYEQHVKYTRRVVKNTVYFKDSRTQTIEGKYTVETVVEVKGTAWFYRPIEKAAKRVEQ